MGCAATLALEPFAPPIGSEPKLLWGQWHVQHIEFPVEHVHTLDGVKFVYPAERTSLDLCLASSDLTVFQVYAHIIDLLMLEDTLMELVWLRACNRTQDSGCYEVF